MTQPMQHAASPQEIVEFQRRLQCRLWRAGRRVRKREAALKRQAQDRRNG